MDFLDGVKKYIENNLVLFVDFLQVGLLSDGNSIAIRPTPGTPPVRYLEGSKVVTYTFQILVAHSDTKTAHDTTEAVLGALDGLAKGAIIGVGFEFIKCEVYTSTNFVEKRTGGEMVFTALFQAELEIKEG